MLGNVYRKGQQSNLPTLSCSTSANFRPEYRKHKINRNTGLLNGLSVEVTQHTHPNYSVVYHAKTTCNETRLSGMPCHSIQVHPCWYEKHSTSSPILLKQWNSYTYTSYSYYIANAWFKVTKQRKRQSRSLYNFLICRQHTKYTATISKPKHTFQNINV